ncbi:MAG TPA: hypothetical protein VFC90_10590 [Planctomycetota bacterium]|nr:hypothetical protein [Planctomycetota bacterium]
MIALVITGIVAFIRAVETHGHDQGSYLIAAAIAFGAATLASRGR